jgi:hypothetical protein
MTIKKNVSAAAKVLSTPTQKAGKSLAASILTKRSNTAAHNVTIKSGKVIVRTVTTHREALKRLADR